MRWGFMKIPIRALDSWRWNCGGKPLVVDTGIHHKRWTREEAIDYLVSNTPNAEYDCIKAIERYIACRDRRLRT